MTNGGGGTFANIWTPSTFAQAGFYVSDTKTPGHVYQMSLEHHVRIELKLDRVENWDFHAPQTEEEAGESAECLSLEISRSKNITIANYHAYRVTRSRAPYPTAVRLYQSSGIHFRNVHVNAESGLATCDAERLRHVSARQQVPLRKCDSGRDASPGGARARVRGAGRSGEPPPRRLRRRLAPGANVRKLEDGFFSIGGAAVDAAGKLYFVDHWQQRIYGWSEAEGLTVERDHPLDPVNLAFDKSGNLLVQSSAGAQGTVYRFRPGSPGGQMTELALEEAKPRPGARAILPVNYWNNGEFANQLNFETMRYTTLGEMFRRDVSAPKAKQYVSPDGSVFLPAARVFQQGPPDYTGWRFSDNLDTHGFLSAAPGERVYVSNESEDITYRATVKADGSLRRSRAVRTARRRVRGGGWARQCVRGERPDLRLQPGGQGDRAHRCAGASARHRVRRRGQANAVHPRTSRAVRDAGCPRSAKRGEIAYRIARCALGLDADNADAFKSGRHGPVESRRTSSGSMRSLASRQPLLLEQRFDGHLAYALARDVDGGELRRYKLGDRGVCQTR